MHGDELKWNGQARYIPGLPYGDYDVGPDLGSLSHLTNLTSLYLHLPHDEDGDFIDGFAGARNAEVMPAVPLPQQSLETYAMLVSQKLIVGQVLHETCPQLKDEASLQAMLFFLGQLRKLCPTSIDGVQHCFWCIPVCCRTVQRHTKALHSRMV